MSSFRRAATGCGRAHLALGVAEVVSAAGLGAAAVGRSTESGGGATVRYGLTAAAAVQFVVERRLSGRRVGGRCVKRTAANQGKKKCARYRAMKGGFTEQGAAGDE